MDKDKIIDGLRVTMEQIVFDPSTGKEYSTDILNDLDRKIYDACKGALEILERLDTDSDTISRQAAIEVIDSFNVFESRCDQIKLEQMIGELPPAQPASCEDAVSRKAVAGIYTALWETIGAIMDRDEWDDVCKATANELPSAQPDIIRCKDCKYGILDYDFPHERYCDFKGNEWNNDDHFCGHAKRREVTT